jgi:hypothetical protein
MNEAEILIRIRTALETGGIDAARSEVAKMTQEVGKSALPAAAANVEHVKLLGTLRGFREVLAGSKAAAEGNVQGLALMGRGLTALGASATRIVPVIGVVAAAWLAFTKIVETSDAAMVEASKTAADLAETAAKLAHIKMDAFVTEMKKVSTEMDRWIAFEDKWTAKWKEVRDAKLGAEIERIKNQTAEGPEQDRQIQAATRTSEDASLVERRANIQHNLEQAEKAMKALDATYLHGGRGIHDFANRGEYAAAEEKAKTYRADLQKQSAEEEMITLRRQREDNAAARERLAAEKAASVAPKHEWGPNERLQSEVQVSTGARYDRNGNLISTNDMRQTVGGSAAQAREAIAGAAQAISAGGDDQAIFDALVKKLGELGARVNVSQERFADLLDALDGVKGEIKAERSKTL